MRLSALHNHCVSTALTVLVGACCASVPLRADEDRVDFNREIRPILSDTCYKCHGPDKAERQAGLRFDTKEGALAKLESDDFAIVPGSSGKSQLYQRITHADPAMRMPPADSGKTLTPEQIALIKQWIDQGAEWKTHWSFIKPERPALPDVTRDGFVRNPIDRFILARLGQEGLEPNPEADKTTLLRRVTFDLTGLPPTLEEIDAFLADDAPDAYEKVVDRLLESPHYGEQMARYWLDAARYGDTHGLHLDNLRSIWPYRDWVIEAFNSNMPFDRFTIEQLAGDLLPDPTADRLVATGFNRCNVTTSEGGSIAEEYRVRYAVDRIETVGTVWMGLTVGCAVCHDHKFDPVSQKEFYRLFAYYANTADKAMDGNALLPPPSIKVPTPEQTKQQEEYRARIAQIEQAIKEKLAGIKYEEPQQTAAVKQPEPREVVWIDDDLPAGASPQGNEGPASWTWVTKPAHPVLSGAKSHTRSASGLSQHFFTGAKPGLKIAADDRLFAWVYIDPDNPPQAIMLQFNDGTWEHRAYWGRDAISFGRNKTPTRLRIGPLPQPGQWVRIEVEAAAVGLKPGSELNGWAFTQYDGTVYWDKAGLVTLGPTPVEFDSKLAWEAFEQARTESDLPEEITKTIKTPADQRTDDQKRQLTDYFLEHVYTKTRGTFAPLHKQLAEVKGQLDELEKSIPSTLVMRDKTENLAETYVLTRGQYDKPDKGQKVEPGVPAVLPPLPDGAPANRLALARWLVDPDHPLTARVTVNRFWQRYFGTGLVKTAEDFGSQGDWPSHPELLDWLATEFMRPQSPRAAPRGNPHPWDVKHLQKLIVMSGTYRQSSKVTPEKLRKDPHNRLLSRGPRFRMDAEMIRDNALAVSGLLVKKIGGESVKPYQPLGLWEAVGYTGSNTVKFVQDHGEKLYRRSLYTFWKRTAPPPSLQTFDAPSRETCVVRRARTNTPLQALALMNDVQFVEASRKLAERMMTEGGSTPEARITFAFRLATARHPDTEELQTLLEVYESQLSEYRHGKEAALKLLSVGESPRNEKLDPSELAAWTMVANLLLNLDETVTKG